MNRILIIINPQNDFIFGNLKVPNASNIIKNIYNILIKEKYSRILVIMDWHPFNHCSFDINGGVWPPHCIQYTTGAAIDLSISNLLSKLGESIKISILEKGCNSDKEEYGTFKDEKIANKYLSKDDSIYICGIAGDYSVYETIKNLLNLGYKNITVIKDCVASIDGGIKLNKLVDSNKLRLE